VARNAAAREKSMDRRAILSVVVMPPVMFSRLSIGRSRRGCEV